MGTILFDVSNDVNEKHIQTHAFLLHNKKHAFMKILTGRI